MKFNPYKVQAIGTDIYEQHIQDVYVSNHYYRQLPEDADLENPIKLAPYGEKIWKSDKEISDPWINLMIAVTVQAVIDYINAYKKMKHWEEEAEKIGKDINENLWLKYLGDNTVYSDPIWNSLKQHGEYVRRANSYKYTLERLEDSFFKQYDITEEILKKLKKMLEFQNGISINHSAGWIAQSIHRNYIAYCREQKINSATIKEE